MYNTYPNYPNFNSYRAPSYYDYLTNQGNYSMPLQNQNPNINNTMNSPNLNQGNMPVDNNTIKGKYVNSLNDVIELTSSSYEPFVCVDFNSQKVYIKTFNIDGSYTIEEFTKNINAKIDTRNQTEKLADTVSTLSNEVMALKNQFNSISNGGVSNESKSAKSK